MTWAVIAGGGTAGHVLPGVAIANALVDGGRDRSSVLYVGSERGLERDLVPAAGLELELLPGRGIARRFTFDNVGAVVGLLRAFVLALRLMRARRPAVVVALGGYASVPCVVAATILRVPIVVAEQNAVPGLANRLAGRFAKVSAVSFAGTDLPHAVLTGNPVRSEMIAVDRRADRSPARRALDVPDEAALVVVFGGSLGARHINEAVRELAMSWTASDQPICIHHVIGDRDFDRYGAVAAAPGVSYRPVRYEHDMPQAFAAADLIVCRSGATSVAELAVVGVPSVLIPLPGAPGDHQTANARSLSDNGAAVLIPDDELDGDRLRSEITRILGDDELRESMESSAAARGRPDAAKAVADLVEATARPTPERKA